MNGKVPDILFIAKRHLLEEGARTADSTELAKFASDAVDFLEQVAQWSGDKQSIVPTVALKHYAKDAQALLSRWGIEAA